MVIELYAILRAMLDLDDPKWQKYDSVMNLGGPVASQVADVFSHEFLHYRQHLGSWGKMRRKVAGKVGRSHPTSDYLSQSNEIQAFAADTARHLQRAFGTEAIQAIRDGRAKTSSPVFRWYVDLGAPETFKVFLRHLVADLTTYH